MLTAASESLVAKKTMADYNFLLESRLSPEQFRVLNGVSRIAADQGFNFYLVGGAVRDLTHGQQVVRDLDFAVEGNVQKILRQFGASRQLTARQLESQPPAQPRLEVEQHFDTRLNSAEVVFAGGIRAEISMTRSETYSRPGRRPEVAPATIFEDLRRRDFSANAMAISLHPNSRGLLLDPTNGAAGIERREFRALHSRSFVEDPSRIYRLLRLGLRLDFKPEERTAQWLESALESRAWEALEPECPGRELRAILYEENCGRTLKMLRERGLLGGLDRKLASAKLPYDRFDKIRAVARTVPGADPHLLNFYCLVERLPGSDKHRLAKKILGHAQTINFALALYREARKLAHALGSSKAALPSHVYTMLRGVPRPLLLFLLAYYPEAKVQNRVKNFLFKFPAVHAKVPRAELQAMGMEPGRKFEAVLEKVFFDQLDARIRTHQQLTKALREYSGIKPPAEEAPPKKAPKEEQKEKRVAGEKPRQESKAKRRAIPRAQKRTAKKPPVRETSRARRKTR